MPQAFLGRLGVISFERAMALEDELCKLRYAGEIPDTILIMEHPPTITMGRSAQSENVLLSPEELGRRGITIAHSNRGGDVTFHTLGQIVLHVVMDLRRRETPLRGFVADLEDVALRVLESYGVAAVRRSEHPGLWVNGRQVMAIGLHMGRGISSHGLSLNVEPNLSSFGVINLCGLPGCEATSIARELGRSVSTKRVARGLALAFAEVFRVELQPVTMSYLTKRAQGATAQSCL